LATTRSIFSRDVPHPLAAPFLQHREAPDVPILQQSPGADRSAVGRERDHVVGVLVETVPLQFLRYALFLDEHGCADRAQHCLAGCPVDRLDGERERFGHGRHYIDQNGRIAPL